MTVDLKALQQQVKALEADLRPTGLADPKLKAEWEDARAAERTASAFEAWLGERVTQVAVGWVLSTVFVRFCEDNDLIEYPFIAGPGERTPLARDLQAAFFERHPEKDDRSWLEASFDALSVSPVAAGLFDRRHNPMWTILPTPYAAKALLDFWRSTDASGEIRFDLTDPDWDTRFLGDLYQDLSESARKTYALLQTPEFVEEFILNYTLDLAIEEFGLEPAPPYGHDDLPHRLRVIDPACGSGHFLLGAFRRLLTAWQAYAPTTDNWVLIANALSSVHGVDKNPFAASVARFRLMLAAMRAANITRLEANVNFPINIAIGDSLLHGYRSYGSEDELPYDEEKTAFTYHTEDIDEYIKSVHMLAFGSYHAVFANPPYITVKDKAESEAYRMRYPSCYREYSLSVPFAERIFKLAVRGSLEGVGAGYAGQITANSFMKREFGKKLIEEFFPQVELTHIIDASGAFVPGHGTPTVILFGRWRFPRADSTVRAILGVRGEPGQPADPAKGFVWQAILHQIGEPGSSSEWIGVFDIARRQFAKHPWSLSGGGANELQLRLERVSNRRIKDLAVRIGFFGMTHADEGMIAPLRSWRRQEPDQTWIRPIVSGEELRDWHLSSENGAFFPYSNRIRPIAHRPPAWLWQLRTELGNRNTFGGGTYFSDGRPWYEWHQLPKDTGSHPWFLAFAFVSTHNHFVLDRGGKVFKQSAPIIKLPGGATEDDHIGLLGVLNSSTACFWLKQVSQNKGNGGIGGGIGDEAWEPRYEFTGTKLEQFPLPAVLPLESGREMDALARQLAAVEPSAVCATATPTRNRLDTARVEYLLIRSEMIARQEELDWDMYHRYGLITDDEATTLIADPKSVPNINLGLRAFEIVLARRAALDEVETQWFVRHRSVPVPEIPQAWPQQYRDTVAKRIEMIERDKNIGLIERPECKRRWLTDTWEDKERAALTNWLLDRCEERSLWYGPDDQPRPMTVNRLADRLRTDADFVSVARLLAGPDADLADVLSGMIADEHVPCVARARYKGEGLVKRAIWEQTWEMQRAEDRTGQRLDITVPPKYTSADFLKNSYWRHRGKLDVPKERFISYPYSGPDSDDSILLGWAGWDHHEQAHALIATIEERASTDGWDGPRLTPLIAALAEVMPWVRQWHNEVDPNFGQSPADAYDAYLTAQREKYAITDEVLASWSPPAPARGRRRG